MTKKEREILRKAIRTLIEDEGDGDYDGAMRSLCELAGLEVKPFPEIKTVPIYRLLK